MDQQSTQKPAAEGGDSKDKAQGTGKMQPFILGNMTGLPSLPKLGDKAGVNAFLEQNKGGTAAPSQKSKSLFGNSMFGNLAPLGGLKMPQTSQISHNEGPEASQDANRPSGSVSIFSKGLPNQMQDPKNDQTTNSSNIESSKIGEGKPDIPPSQNSLFSFGLPGLSEKSRAENSPHDQKDAIQLRADAPAQAKTYNLSNLQSNAMNYLDQIQDEQSLDSKVESSSIQKPSMLSQKHDVSKSSILKSQPIIFGQDVKKEAGTLPNENNIPSGGMFPSSMLSSLGGMNPIKKPLADVMSKHSAPPQAPMFGSSNPNLSKTSSFNPNSSTNLQSTMIGGRSQSGLGFNPFQQPGARASMSGPNTQSTGDMITSKYHTYHSIGTLAPLVNQDENLSLTLNSNNVKVFLNHDKSQNAKNLICFIDQDSEDQAESGNNISLLINQSDQIQNILSGHHQKGRLQGPILDFTVRQFKYLYLLYAKSIVILNIGDLLAKSSQVSSQEIKIVDSIQLMADSSQANLHQYSCIEMANKDRSLLLFNDITSRRAGLSQTNLTKDSTQNAQVLHIDCEDNTQTPLVFNIQEQGQSLIVPAQDSCILDIEIWSSYLAILFDKNLVVVFDLSTSEGQGEMNQAAKSKKKQQPQDELTNEIFQKPVFKAKFADATDSITQLFFIKDFKRIFADDSSNENDSEGNESEDSIQGQEPLKFRGQFLLIESKKLGESASFESRKKAFRKLHIVEIQDLIGPLNQIEPGSKILSKGQSQALNYIDNLTIAEQTSKFVSYDYEKGIAFLLNQDKSDRLIKFFSVKLKRDVVADDSDSDEAAAKAKDGAQTKDANCVQRLRFEYITEVRLQISNESFSAIQKSAQSKADQEPYLAYLRYLNSCPDKQKSGLGSDSENFYIYTSILDQVLVFERPLTEMRPTSTDMIKTLSSSSNKSPAVMIGGKDILQKKSTKDISLEKALAKGGVIDMSKIEGFVPTNKVEPAKKPPKASKKKPVVESDEDDMKLTEDPQAHEDPLGDAENEQIVHENATNMIGEILDDESDAQDDQAAGIAAQVMMQQIDRECREEEELEAKLLRKKIKEETQDVLSNDDDDYMRDQDDDIGRQGAQFPKDKKKASSKNENFVYVKKEKDTDDLSQNQNLTKKERKALKKQENKKANSNSQEKITKDQSNIGSTSLKLKQGGDSLKKQSAQNNSKLQEQQQIVENFQELTKKYQDLAQKMNQLHQQVSRQQQQKIEVDTAIRKAVKESINALMVSQIKEVVVPIITKKMKSLDDQVNDVIMPKIEEQIGKLFLEIIEKGELAGGKGGSEGQITPQAIQQLIQREFRDTMSNQIVPSIELVFKKLLTQLEKKLEQVDLALYEKLSEDEDKHENMVQYYQNSLVWLKSFHNKVGSLAKDQLKGQMQQQLEFQKDMSRNFQSEVQQRVQEMVTGQIQSQIQSQIQTQVQQQVQLQVQQQIQMQVQQQVQIQIQHQVQQQLQQMGISAGQQPYYQQPQAAPMAPPLLATPTHSQQSYGGTPSQPIVQQQPQQFFAKQAMPSSFATQAPSQSQVIMSQPLDLNEDGQEDEETQQLIKQQAYIQHQLKLKQSGVKLRKQQSSQNKKDQQDYSILDQNIDKKFNNDKNVTTYKVGPKGRSMLIYDNSEDDEEFELEHRNKGGFKKQEEKSFQVLGKQFPKGFWDLDEAKRGSDTDPEDVDDGNKYFEEQKLRDDNFEEDGDDMNRYAQESRVRGDDVEDDEESHQIYKEAPKMRPYDDGLTSKNEKPIGSSQAAAANRGAMRLLMGQSKQKEERQDDAGISNQIDDLIYQGLTEQHKQRLFGDQEGFQSQGDGFDGKSAGGLKQHRQLKKMQFGAPLEAMTSKHGTSQNVASDLLNSSIEDRGDGISRGSKSKQSANATRELTSWKDSQKDPMQGFSGYGIQRNPQPYSSQQKRAQRGMNRNRGNQNDDGDMPSWY